MRSIKVILSDFAARLKRSYRRFKLWQKKPFKYHQSKTQHTCYNCGQKFVGNYCPTCGQEANAKPFTWKTVKDGLLDVWGLGSRSMPYSMWQLLWRPGYFIGDYISGKRHVSFPPVKMLVIISLFITIADSLLSLNGTVVEPTKVVNFSGLMYYLQTVSNWLDAHDEWGTLMFMSMFIVPTWCIFKNSPQHTRHNIPQGFFIQVFTSIHMLLITSLAIILWDMDLSEQLEHILVVLFLTLLYDYKQLFGYNWWGTIWRVFTVILASLGFISILDCIYDLLNDIANHNNLWDPVGGLIYYTAVTYAILAAGHAIDGRTWLKKGMLKAVVIPLCAASLAIAVSMLIDWYLVPR